MRFSEFMAAGVIKDDRFAITIPEDWMQGRTTYGGLSVALCFETVQQRFPDLPPLRSALVSFIGPAGGEVEGRAQILRQGKSVTFVEADIHGEKGLATRCVFAFGKPRASRFDQTFTPRPHMPAPEDCPPFIPKGAGPRFADQFESRLAKGARPMSGASDHDHFVWVRHLDRAADGVVALLALADMPPPAVLPMFTEFAPISSMTWMLNIVSGAPISQDGWWLLQSRAENAAEGYSSQDMLVWNRSGDLIITGRQSVAIFL